MIEMVERRSYNQFCGLASALDLLGERWTLLIVRELLLGPRRFNELADNLVGLGPNLLTERLRMLTQSGVIARSNVAADGRGRLYELTEAGEGLRAPVLELARWGLDHVESNTAGEVRAEWALLAVEAMMQPAAVPSANESYEFNIDGQLFHVAVANSGARVARGPAVDPALAVATDARTFIEIGSRVLTPLQAVLGGKLKMVGDNAAIARCSALLGLDT
jgi:DNA-binding HxlR family transcriptional regulator